MTTANIMPAKMEINIFTWRKESSMTTKVGMSNASPCGYVSVVLTSVAVVVLSAIEPTMMNANMVMNTATSTNGSLSFTVPPTSATLPASSYSCRGSNDCGIGNRCYTVAKRCT